MACLDFTHAECFYNTPDALPAIGAASPEQVTKDMIAEVAEQDKLMRQAEDIMRTEHPMEEVIVYRGSVSP